MTPPITVTLRDDDPEVRPGNLARVEPAVPAVVDALTVARRTLRPVPGRGFAAVDVDERLFEVDRRRPDAVLTWAGVVPRLRRVLAAAGHEVVVTDERVVDEEFLPDRSFLGRLEPISRVELSKAADNLFGRYVVEDCTKAGWAGWLASLFANARVVVAAATKKDVGVIVGELNGRFKIPARRRNGPGPAAGPARVVVAAHAGVAALAARGPLVLVLVDAHRAVADAHFNGLQRVLPIARRVYGLVPPDLTPDPLTAARLRLVTGDLLDTDVYRGRPPAVTVAFARSAGGRVRQTADARGRNEAAYWANEERNRRVADLAGAAAAGDVEALERFGVGGAAAATPGCGGVAVVAGSAAQADHLAGLLKWPAYTTVPGAEQQRRTGKYVVTTASYAAARELDSGVIVRADGGHGPLNVPMLTSRRSSRETVTVLDLDDRFDVAARADARRRADNYRRQGFRVVREPDGERYTESRA